MSIYKRITDKEEFLKEVKEITDLLSCAKYKIYKLSLDLDDNYKEEFFYILECFIKKEELEKSLNNKEIKEKKVRI